MKLHNIFSVNPFQGNVKGEGNDDGSDHSPDCVALSFDPASKCTTSTTTVRRSNVARTESSTLTDDNQSESLACIIERMFSVEDGDEVIIATSEDPPIDGEEHEVELKDVSELLGIYTSSPSEHNRSVMKKSILTITFTPKLRNFISTTVGKDRAFVRYDDCDESVEVSLPKEDDQVSTDISSCNSLKDKLEIVHEDGSGLTPHQLCQQFVCDCYDPIVSVAEAESSSHVNVISHNVKVPPTKTKLFGTLSKLMKIGGKNDREYADCNDINNVENIQSEELLIVSEVDSDDGKTWEWPWMPEEKSGARVQDSADIVKETMIEVSLPRGLVRMKSVTSDESFDDELCDVTKIDKPPQGLDLTTDECDAVNTQANVMSSVVISDDTQIKKPIEDDVIRDLLLQEEDTENGFECDWPSDKEVALKAEDYVNPLSSRVGMKKFTALMMSRRYILPINRTKPTLEKCVVASKQDDNVQVGEDLCFNRAKEEDDDLSRVDGEKLVQSKEMPPFIDENRSLSPCMEQVNGSPASRHFAAVSSSQIFSFVKLKQLISLDRSSPKTKSCELKSEECKRDSDAKSGVPPHDIDQDEVHEDELDVLTTDNNSILDNNELLLIPTRETASPLSKDEVYFSGNDDTIGRIDDNAFLRPEIHTEPAVEESQRLADTNLSNSNNRETTYKSVPLNRMRKTDHLAIFKKLPIHQRLQLYRNFRSQKSGNDDNFPVARDIFCVSRQSEMSDISIAFVEEVTSNTKLFADYDTTSWTMQSKTEAEVKAEKETETDNRLTTIVKEKSVTDPAIRFVMTDDKCQKSPGVFSICLCHSVESYGEETEDTFEEPGLSTMDTYTDSGRTYFSSSIHSVLSTNYPLQTWRERMMLLVDDLVLSVEERNAANVDDTLEDGLCNNLKIAPTIDDYTLTDTDDVDENTCYSKKHCMA